MIKSGTQYLAQFDMIATGYMARKSSNTYAAHLLHFKSAIQSSASIKECVDVRVVLLHHLAVAASDDLGQLCHFMTAVRGSLLSHSIFLRAVIAPGAIPIDPRDWTAEGVGTNMSAETMYPTDNLLGLSLGAGTALAFGEHYRFSGIGIRLVGLSEKELKKITFPIVKNHFVHSRSRKVEAFDDLGFESIADSTLDNICVEYVKLRTRFRGISNHFVPIFISIIRSLPWHATKDRDAVKSNDVAMDLYDRLTGKWFTANLSDVPSRELILFSLLDVLYRARGASDGKFRKVASKCSVDWYVRRIEDTPGDVLSEKSRDALFERLAALDRPESAVVNE